MIGFKVVISAALLAGALTGIAIRSYRAAAIAAADPAPLAAATFAPVAPARAPVGRTAAAPARSFREIGWDDLMPAGWDPTAQFKGRHIDRLRDGEEGAQALMSEMRQAWDDAPTVAALDGAAIRIPGYLVPLDEDHGRLKEFLLVPYFGACIHTPPPPANQIIHVVATTPLTGYKTMDAVWISGAITRRQQDSFMGSSGYEMTAEKVARYVAPTQPAS